MAKNYKLVKDCDTIMVYAYETDSENLTITFFLETKTVDINYSYFALRDILLKPLWDNEKKKAVKHSSCYGEWKTDPIINLSAEDIEFIYTKCKELFY